MTDPGTSIPDSDGVPRTSDQLEGEDREQDAAAEDSDDQVAVDEEAVNEEESSDVTLGGVAGQAGVGNA
jgi:hypothetical protein